MQTHKGGPTFDTKGSTRVDLHLIQKVAQLKRKKGRKKTDLGRSQLFINSFCEG